MQTNELEVLNYVRLNLLFTFELWEVSNFHFHLHLLRSLIRNNIRMAVAEKD
jgi:hypothetical protein